MSEPLSKPFPALQLLAIVLRKHGGTIALTDQEILTFPSDQFDVAANEREGGIVLTLQPKEPT
ncbi:MAG: hypothetical protein NXI31_11375 [bacterium]|nr:hypothetical protein [bacterium]